MSKHAAVSMITHCPACGAELDEPIPANAVHAYTCTGDGRCYCSELQWATHCPGACPNCGAVWVAPLKEVDTEKIEASLGPQEDWGREGKPSRQVIVDFLVHVGRKVGLLEVRMEDDGILYFRTEEPLTPTLAFEFARAIGEYGDAALGEGDNTEFYAWWRRPPQ